MKNFNLLIIVVGVGLTIAPVEYTTASAQSFNVGSFAGGMLGGVLAEAMMNNAHRPVVYGRPVYRERRQVFRHVARHAAPIPARHRTPAVVDTAADPFATKATGGLTPVVAKQ